MKYILTFIMATLLPLSIFGEDMQKVIILPFKNIDKNPNYQYLEDTITDAIREKLKKIYAFSETDEREWKTLSKKNFMYDEDCYTSTYGMTLGLLSDQDVIINGGFTVKKNEDKKENTFDAVSTVVRIISVTEKKIVSEINVDVPANNEIFKTISDVADKAAAEASKVLPNKEEWEKNRVKKTVAKKAFSNVALGIRGGASFYINGWADQFAPKLPALGVVLRANLPVISDWFFVELDYTYYQHELIPGSINFFTANNLVLTATNNVVGAFAGYDFKLSPYFLLSPKIGGGAIFQATQVSGSVSQNVTNTIAWAGAGFEFAWLATDTLHVVLDATFNTQIENYAAQSQMVFTFFPVIELGISIGF